jgi:4,5-DOPA dioxygenase extradiol
MVLENKKSLMPALFVSHGAPTLLIDECPASEFLKKLSNIIPKPSAILVISAHWETKNPRITSKLDPHLIYDFGGFPDELYKAEYNVKGSAMLALQVKDLLKDFRAELDEIRGLDHGVWVPLKLIYPEADIPVVQLSINSNRDANYHYELGKKLFELREQGVLIIGSGSITHNLRAFFGHQLNSAPDNHAEEFSEWVHETLKNNKIKTLTKFEEKAPHASWNHPTTEHFMPLLATCGAAGEKPQIIRLHQSFTYGVISMDVYLFN